MRHYWRSTFHVHCIVLTSDGCRGKTGVPPIGRFTHRSSAAGKETNITLQDGCFGVATLMRIAALFIPSTEPHKEAPLQAEAGPGGITPPELPRKETATELLAEAAASISLVHETACEPPEDEGLQEKELQEKHDFVEANEQGQDNPAIQHRADGNAVKSSTRLRNSGSTALEEKLGLAPESMTNSEQLDLGLQETRESPLTDKASNKQSFSTTMQKHEKAGINETASTSSASLDEDGIAPASESQEDERQPVDKADQVSIEIVRCRAVCPDWQDSALSDSPVNARPDTLVLAIPRLLLQLPPSNPAMHPSCHPVQVGLCQSFVTEMRFFKKLTYETFVIKRSYLPTLPRMSLTCRLDYSVGSMKSSLFCFH